MPEPRVHGCAVRGCQAQIAAWLHFCTPHYKRLPEHVKKGLAEEWRYMKRNGVRHTERQLELIREGALAVEEKLQKVFEKHKAIGGDLAAT